MFRMLRILPLLMLETAKPEGENDDPFMNLFSEIRDTMIEIRDRLPNLQSEPEEPEELETPAANPPEPEPEREPEKLEVEPQPEPTKKRNPWDRRSR